MDGISTKAFNDVIDSFSKRQTDTETQVASLLEGQKTILSKLEDFGQDPPNTDVADLERGGIFDQFASWEVGGLPAGKVIIGGFAAILASELVDGFASEWEQWKRGLVKAGIAFAVGKWGRKWLGSGVTNTVVLLLAFDALRDLSPVDKWADQMAEWISGKVTTGGLAGDQSRGKTDVTKQADKVAKNYYDKAFG